MSALDRIEKSEIRNLLGKGWLTHDGMWFYHTGRQLGIELANSLNRAAIKSMAPIEVQRAKRVLGFGKDRFDTFDELMEFIQAALEVTLPDSVSANFHFRSPSNNLIHWDWLDGQCFAYKGIRQIGMIDGYRCGVIYRIECWLEALGIVFSTRPEIEGCLMHAKGRCRGEIRVFTPG